MMELKKFIVTLTENFERQFVVFADSKESALKGTLCKYNAGELDNIMEPASLDVQLHAEERCADAAEQHLFLISEPSEAGGPDASHRLLDPDALFLVGLVCDNSLDDAT